MKSILSLCTAWLLYVAVVVSPTFASPPDALQKALTPILNTLRSTSVPFAIEGKVTVPIDNKQQDVELRLVRYSGESFDLELTHQDYAIKLFRRPDSTTFLLPKHKTAFIGSGNVQGSDHLRPVVSPEAWLGS